MPNWCAHARLYEIVMQFRVRPQLNYAQVKSMCAIKMCVHVVRNALAKKAFGQRFVRSFERNHYLYDTPLLFIHRTVRIVLAIDLLIKYLYSCAEFIASKLKSFFVLRFDTSFKLTYTK